MKKKPYTKPELCTIFIDNEISLVMATSETEPPGGPGPTGAAQSQETSPTQKSNFNDNPFGD